MGFPMDLEGLQGDLVTLPNNGTSPLVRGQDEGKPVNINAAGEVVLSAADETFIGIARTIEDDVVVVQMAGVVALSYTGTVGTGWRYLVADGSGGVKDVTPADADATYDANEVTAINTAKNIPPRWVLRVDATEGKVFIKL